MSRRSLFGRVGWAALLGLTVSGHARAAIAQDTDVVWEGVTVRVAVFEPFSPFREVSYEWKTRGSSPMVTWSRVHVADFGRDDELALVTPDVYAAWVSELDVCLEAIEGAAEGDVDAGYADLRLTVGGEAYEARLALETLDDAGAACVGLVRDRVLETIAVPTYRNPYWREGESGLLRIDADATAHVYVDGVDTRETTPVMDYPVTPGRHEIRWVDTVTGTERTEEVSVAIGQTTSIRVELR